MRECSLLLLLIICGLCEGNNTSEQQQQPLLRKIGGGEGENGYPQAHERRRRRRDTVKIPCQSLFVMVSLACLSVCSVAVDEAAEALGQGGKARGRSSQFGRRRREGREGNADAFSLSPL